MNDLACVVRIIVGFEAQAFGQIAHRRITGGIDRVHLAESVAAGRLDQVFHQQRAQPQVLPFIGDRHRALALMGACAGIAADADFDQLAVLVNQCNEGGALFVVGVHQLVEQSGAGFADLGEKTHVPGFGGQALDEVVFAQAILLPERPDQYMAAVLERLNPVLSGDRRISGDGLIVVVFDGEHGHSPSGSRGWRALKKASACLPSTRLPTATSDLHQTPLSLTRA